MKMKGVMLRSVLNLALALAGIGITLAPATAAAQEGGEAEPPPQPGETRVVILGVEHAGQLFAEAYRPAVLRAWLARVDPDGIAIERHPDAYAANDFYGFTFEIQDIIIPWAEANVLPLHPFDWEPSREEQELAFGFDLQETPFLRPLDGWGAFVHFPPDRLAAMNFFLGEEGPLRDQVIRWSETPGASTQGEMARRLYLYRTLLQARRIQHAAARHPGGTLVVVVGAMHQPDLEVHLGRFPGIQLVPASSFGLPTREEAAAFDLPEDFVAIAWANLFSVHAMVQGMDVEWLGRVVPRLRGHVDELEVELLSLRLDEWVREDASNADLERWLMLADRFEESHRPSWTGAIDSTRIDSDFDPFAGLGLQQRSLHEASRVALRLGREAEAVRLRERVAASLDPFARVQYLGYWERFVGVPG